MNNFNDFVKYYYSDWEREFIYILTTEGVVNKKKVLNDYKDCKKRSEHGKFVSDLLNNIKLKDFGFDLYEIIQEITRIGLCILKYEEICQLESAIYFVEMCDDLFGV